MAEAYVRATSALRSMNSGPSIEVAEFTVEECVRQ